MTQHHKINVQEETVTISQKNGEDYICITDMAKAKTDNTRAADVIKNWIRTRTTLEFLGTWERMYNPNFKVVEFDHFKTQAGLPSFVLSPLQWVEKTNAIGIFSKSVRYGGMARLEQLVVLSNFESINSILIHQGLEQAEINKIAITQMNSLLNHTAIKKLK